MQRAASSAILTPATRISPVYHINEILHLLGVATSASVIQLISVSLSNSKLDKEVKRITATEFKAAVELDPAWASKLTEPVGIRGFCDMRGSPITHLSPLLRFLGRNRFGYSAQFHQCNSLKVAEGSFAGFVNFSGSGIERIGDLKIKKPSRHGWAAFFDRCEHLKAATGTYTGSVSFENSGITSIEQLIVNQPDVNGEAASFSGCANLMVAEGTFAGSVTFNGAGITKIANLVISKVDAVGMAANFHNCTELRVAEGNFPGFVNFRNSGVKTVGKLVISGSNEWGVKADFTGCAILVRNEFLGPEYEMDDKTRQHNLERMAALKDQRDRQDLEI